MRIYFGLMLLVVMPGFVLLPSICISNSMASARLEGASSPAQQAQAGQVVPTAAAFTVNSTADTPDAAPGNGVCNDGTGNCTLRAAIMEANALAGPDTINFDIAPAGPKTLNFTGPLPAILGTVIINGTTQPGFLGAPIIELHGMGVPPPLLALQGPDSTIRGLIVNGVDGTAVALMGDNDRVVGSFIGTDLTGTAPGPGNVGAGVAVLGSNCSVGGTSSSDRNVIAFNGSGVSVMGGVGNSVLSNSIFGNAVIGIDLNGDDVTPDDACDGDNGPNGLQNFPVLTGAQSTGAVISIQGMLNAAASGTFRIEFFANAACHQTGFGQGESFVGATIVTTDASCNAAFSASFPAPVAAGQFVTATATDGFNNTSEFSQCVPVAAINCTITCPANLTRSNDPMQCGAVVTYAPPTTSGACGTINCSPPSGSFFPKGTTTVTCTSGAGPSCLFTVTVVDTQPPTITCPPLRTAVTATVGGSSTVVTYPVPSANDNCSGVAASCDPPSGATFPLGCTTVTCTATDTSGNTSTCTFAVCVFNIYLADESDPGNWILINTATGDYRFRCDGVTYTGAGDVTIEGNTYKLEHNSSEQRVRASVNGPAGIGTASLQAPPGVLRCSISYSDPNTNPCAITCPADVTSLPTTPGGNSAVVNYPPPTTSGNCPGVTFNCDPPSGSVFPLGITTVTCMATDPEAHTTTCTFTVLVSPCMISCPANVIRLNDPNQCGAVVTYPAPTTNDNCGTITCSPASGAFFQVGTTTVTCTTSELPSCRFTVRVTDNTPPRVTCPAPVVTALPSGQSSVRVSYPDATVTDNCPEASVQCSPPSGSLFPAGTTFVTCVGTDLSLNSANCVFGVTVRDGEAPVLRCPANVTVDVPSSQCSAAVTYPAATVSDNFPGATVACAPPSGSTFPVGVTTVTCTATDVAGNRTACTFNVTLTGGVTQAVISPASVTVKAVNVLSSKNNKRIKTGEFSILNSGCGPLRLVFRSIRRVTDQSKFSNTDDSAFFSVFSRAADGSPTGPNLIGQQVTIDQGSANQRAFVVRFAPSIPVVTGKTSGLAAVDVLPNSFQSVLSFDGTDRTVTINAAVRTGVAFIDPVNPQNPAVATLCRSGNQFVVNYWLYDSDKSDVKTARYEFLDGSGNVIAVVDNVDLAGPLGQSAIVNGQSFNVENAFTGANDNTSVTKVRVTVFGGDSSDTVTSSTLQSSCGAAIQSLTARRQITLLLPVLKLDAGKP